MANRSTTLSSAITIDKHTNDRGWEIDEQCFVKGMDAYKPRGHGGFHQNHRPLFRTHWINILFEIHQERPVVIT